MLHPVPRSVFHGFGSAHGPRFPSALDILQEQTPCPDTNINIISNIVEYLEEQAANTTTTITATSTNTSARGTPVATGRSVNEPSGLQLVSVDSGSGSGTDRMSDVNDAAVSPKAAAGTALMESPFIGTYGLGISTSSASSAAVEASSSKPPSSGKASSSTTAPTRPWTANEDEALRGVMRTTPGRSWPEISKRAFPRGERNKHECCARWKILSTPKATKGPWTSEEDNLLLDLVEECGPEKWVVIATKIQTRSGKQCRERWHNHLDPAIKKTPFTAEEDETIWRLYSQWGSKWAEIAKHLPGRPDNMIKNHFNTSVQRNKRKQRARATANTEGGIAPQESEDYAIPSIGLSSSHLKQEDLGDAGPSSATSNSFVDSHRNMIGSGVAGGAGPPSSSGPNTTYIQVARDRYLPYRRPLPRPSLLHAQHSSSSSSALGSPSIISPGTPHSPYLSMPPNSATTSATSPISFSASSNSTSYMRGPLSASLPPSASPSQSGFMIHSHGPPGSAGSYAHAPGSFRYPPLPTRGYSDPHTTSPAPPTPHEFSPPLPGSPHFSAYPQYSHARTTQQGGQAPSSAGGGGGVTFGFPRNSTNPHYQAYYPASPVSGSYLPIPGSPHAVGGPGSAQMALSRSLPAQLSNPNSPPMHGGAMSPAMSESALAQSGQALAAVSPAISPEAAAAKAEHQNQERQSYFQQQQQNLYFPVVPQPQDETRQGSPNTQYSPQLECVGSHPVSPPHNQEEGATGSEKDAGRISFRRIPGSTITSSQESGALDYDSEQSYAVPRSARSMQSSLASPGSPASGSSSSTAQQHQGFQLSPLLPMIVTHRGSISSSGLTRPPFIHAATTTFLSPSTERLSIHTSMPSPTLSPHMSSIPPASAPPTTTSMLGNPASAASAEARMSPQQYHHHHPHSPYYYTHQQQQQGFPGLSPEYMHRSDMQQQQQQQWHSQQRHHSPLPEMTRALPGPLSISANYEDAQRQDEEMQFPRPDCAGESVPHSPYVAPASTLMSASTSANTVTSTSTAAVELSSPASSSLVTPPQQHEDRMPSIHLQYEGSTGLESHGEAVPEHENRFRDIKDQTGYEGTSDMVHGNLQEVHDTYDQDMH